MCLSVCYAEKEKIIITQFAQQNALLPIKMKTAGTKLIPWGRRTYENGKLPLGGWASLDDIEKGKWNRYFPKSVKISVQKFFEESIEGQGMWFDVTDGQFIHGILLSQGTEHRVYVVTISPNLADNIYPRWPRLIIT